ncbi:hypothetical protein AVEN_82741-1 [Araneus ventricosus]|uniref:Uncharacterized protein n=1 Tax=Araneus ventricosus TaxID=182803 RepID=A0A4Y2E923_ARAVE|nr:hypothetical protein AVEN_82741-1 [Araneus ventricosus]
MPSPEWVKWHDGWRWSRVLEAALGRNHWGLKWYLQAFTVQPAANSTRWMARSTSMTGQQEASEGRTTNQLYNENFSVEKSTSGEESTTFLNTNTFQCERQ